MVRDQEKCRLSPLSTFLNDGTAATAKPDSDKLLAQCDNELSGAFVELR